MNTTIQNPVLANLLRARQAPLPTKIAEFMKPVEETIKNQDAVEQALESALWAAWGDVILVASETRHEEQGHLVEFVKQVSMREGPQQSNGASAQLWGQPVEWKRLTMLGPTLRAFWNMNPETQEDALKWKNLNAFVAHLTVLSSAPGDAFDFSLYGIWALRNALESHSSPNQTLSVQTAGLWMLYASDVLEERSRRGQMFEGKSAKQGDLKELDGKEWRGLCWDRWEFWVKRFKDLEERSEGSVRELVKEAASKMEAER
ncbi:hypothetical protein BP5796_07101 [Coleophoma crateriformis]|uniref:Uncharacterized protein n=1 Tax=Coleophoma crateriformis TaxID=565419 RepID=A0A3D8RHX3_9HELO|nr:hypothetical protein BP5796_07101 [Coleophoma crateriformis]